MLRDAQQKQQQPKQMKNANKIKEEKIAEYVLNVSHSTHKAPKTDEQRTHLQLCCVCVFVFVCVCAAPLGSKQQSEGGDWRIVNSEFPKLIKTS